MAYPLPINATENITGVYTLFLWLNNDVCSGYLFSFIIMAIGIILFISLKDYPNSKAFAASSFTVFVLSLILRTINLLPNKVLYLSIILMGVGYVWVHYENKAASPF